MAVAQRVLDPRNLQASRLMVFAAWSVEGLYYLADIDDAYFAGRWRNLGYDTSVIDLTHARWASGTAMTALDQIAAAIGALHMPPKRNAVVYDVGSFDHSSAAVPTCVECRRWIFELLADPDWSVLKNVRDQLVHRAMSRGLFGRTHDPDDISTYRTELEFEVGKPKMPARDIVELSRSIAFRHVSSYLKAVDAETV